MQATAGFSTHETGTSLTLADFVRTGDPRSPVPRRFRLSAATTRGHDGRDRSGIGRMTCAFTRRFGPSTRANSTPASSSVAARPSPSTASSTGCDVQVPDGHTLGSVTTPPTSCSAITLQTATARRAALVEEVAPRHSARRNDRLNFRFPIAGRRVPLPLGAIVRAGFSIPGVGTWLSRRRFATRLAWQANRLDPHQVLQRSPDG